MRSAARHHCAKRTRKPLSLRLAAMLAAAVLAACAPGGGVKGREGPEPITPSLVASPKAAPMTTATDCLARTVYFEARGQSDKALDAVAHVVINRVDNPSWPGTVCAVVREGGESPPCQFSWWCDGHADEINEPNEFRRAQRAARLALAGRSADPTDGATMFHSTRIRPYWTRVAQGPVKIDDQIFWKLD